MYLVNLSCLSKKALRLHVRYTPTFINNLTSHVTLETRLYFFFCMVQLFLCVLHLHSAFCSANFCIAKD